MLRRRLLSKLFCALAICLLQNQAGAGVSTPFTDQDLANLLASASRGVIYVWSPHMPYSVRGAVEARRLIDQLELTPILLLDPNADAALASREREGHVLPVSAMRRMQATSLWRMGVTQHFPTVVVFADGRLDAQMLPGYTPPADLLAFIRQRLQSF